LRLVGQNFEKARRQAGQRARARWWEVRDVRGELACVTVHERGAVEVMRRLAA
jgi:hypothetical protein